MTTKGKGQAVPKLANLRVREIRPLLSPAKMKKEIPVQEKAEQTVRQSHHRLPIERKAEA